ncbi:class F sortase [Blastococcus sp. SYSU DS0539]
MTPLPRPGTARVRPGRGLSAVLALLLVALGGVLAAPGRALADEAGAGLLRVAHLSPDTPAVDVSLTPAAPPGQVLTDPGPVVAGGLGYGEVGGYAELPAGAYAVSVRAAGAPVTTPPVLATRLEVSAGQAWTVALTGSFARLSLSPLPDDLSAPPPGAARLRVLAAAATLPSVDVVLDDGPPLATDLRFPGAGAPVAVPGGRHVVRVPGTDVAVALDLPAGTVGTVLVLDRPGGGVELRPVVDATGPAVSPEGGVEAGGGPGAPEGWLSQVLAVLTAAARFPPPSAGAAAPVRLQVPAAGIDTAVVGAGLDRDGALVPPADPELTGWFTGGPLPGAPGPAVLTGHVDWAGRPGAFSGLAEVTPGDEVRVARADGTTARFRVTAVDRYAKTAFPGPVVYAPTPAAELRLITCGGPFDEGLGSYRDNVVVSAELIG